MVNEVDEILTKQSEFLHRVVREFRLRRESRLNPKSKAKKGGAQQPPSQTPVVAEAVVYIAEKQPPWKIEILKIIDELYKVCACFV